jgi:hypothetical protein
MSKKIIVWWIPQVPMNSFDTEVANYVEAKMLLDTLANYDLFQLNNNIKPDYANAGGVCIVEDGEREDWHAQGEEEVILDRLFPKIIVDSLDDLTMEQVRQFQAELDKLALPA